MVKSVTVVILSILSLVIGCDTEVVREKVSIENHYATSFAESDRGSVEVGSVFEATSELPPYHVEDVIDEEVLPECPLYGDERWGYSTSWMDSDLDQPFYIDNLHKTLTQEGVLGVKDECGSGYIVHGVDVSLLTSTFSEAMVQLTVRVGKKNNTVDCISYYDGGGPGQHLIHCIMEEGVGVRVWSHQDDVRFSYRVTNIPTLSQNLSEWTLFAVLFVIEDIDRGTRSYFTSAGEREFVWVE